MLNHQEGGVRKLFNISGIRYRELKLKDCIAVMSDEEAIALLSGDWSSAPF